METFDPLKETMNSDFLDIEETLAAMKPLEMSADLFARLDDAMCHAHETAEAEEEVDIAEELSDLMPSAMSPELFARLDDAMARWHETVPVEEKVIPLNQEDVEKAKKESSWLGWKSAAAVALFGGTMALMSTGTVEQNTAPVMVSHPANLNSVSSRPSVSLSDNHPNIIPASTFRPGGAQSDILSAENRGVVWTQNGQAVQCIELKVSDQVQFKNQNGEQLTIQKPKTQIFLFPIKVD